MSLKDNKTNQVVRKLLLSPEASRDSLQLENQTTDNLNRRNTYSANIHMINQNVQIVADAPKDVSTTPKDTGTDITRGQKAVAAFSLSSKPQGDNSLSSKIVSYNNSQFKLVEELATPQPQLLDDQTPKPQRLDDQIAELSQENVQETTSKQYEMMAIVQEKQKSQPVKLESPPKLDLTNMLKSEDDLNDKNADITNLNDDSKFFIDNQDIMGRVDGISSDLSLDHNPQEHHQSEVKISPKIIDTSMIPKDSLLMNRPDPPVSEYPPIKPKTQQNIRIPVQEYLNVTHHDQSLLTRNKQSRSTVKRREIGKSVNYAQKQKSIMSSDSREVKQLDSSFSARHILFHSKRTPSTYNMLMAKPTVTPNQDIASFLSDHGGQELAKMKIKQRKSVSTLNKYLNSSSNQHMSNQSKANLPTISYQQQQMLQDHYKQSQLQDSRFNKSINAASNSNLQQKKGGRAEGLKIQQNFYENNQFIMTPNESVFTGKKNMALPIKRREMTKTQQNIMQSFNIQVPYHYDRPSVNNEELMNLYGGRDALTSFRKKDRQQYQIGQSYSKLDMEQMTQPPQLEMQSTQPNMDELHVTKTFTQLGKESTQDGGKLGAVTSLSGGTETVRTRSTNEYIRRSQNRLQSSLKKNTQFLPQRDSRNIAGVGLMAFDNLSESLRKSNQILQISETGPKNTKAYNQKAQLAVSLSKELYKAKQILKEVVNEGKTNRRQSQRYTKRMNQQMVKSMNNCFVNPDILDPTVAQSDDGTAAPSRFFRKRQSQAALTEKKANLELNDEVIISIPVNSEEQEIQEILEEHRRDIHIQDQTIVNVNTDTNSLFLEKIIAEREDKQEIKLPTEDSPYHNQRKKKNKELQLAYGQATKVPLKLMKMQEKQSRQSKPRIESQKISKKNSLTDFGLNYTKSQEKFNNQKQPQFSQGDKLSARQRSSENIHKYKQVYGLHKVPLLDLIEQRNARTRDFQIKTQQLPMKKKPSEQLHEQKLVTPITAKIEDTDNVKTFKLTKKHEIVQQIKQLDKMKKIHNDFQKLQNVGNYNGPILQQIKKVMSAKDDGAKSQAKSTSRLYPELRKSQKPDQSQSNFQIFFDKNEMNISGTQTALSHLNPISPSGPVSATSQPKKQAFQKKLSTHRASHSAINMTTPLDPIEAAKKMSELQKSINDMNRKMNQLQQQQATEELKYQAKKLDNEQKSNFQEGLRKKLLSIKQGQLMINTASGEQLYQDMLDKEKENSILKERLERQKRQRELSRKRMAEAGKRDTSNDCPHYLQGLNHDNCKKCANSKNKSLSTAFKYKGMQPPRKWLLPQDPIERYYRKYIMDKDDSDEEKYHIEMDPWDLHHPTFTHHVTCPCAKFNMAKIIKQWRVKNSAMNSSFRPEKMPSKKRQIKAIDEINSMTSPEQAYNTSRFDDDIQAILLAVQQKCDCHIRYKESLLKRMRNQQLYQEFLKKKEDKNQYEEGKEHKRTKSEYTKMYGYEKPQSSKYDHASSCQHRDSNSMDRALVGTVRNPCRRTCSSIHNPMFHMKHHEIKLRYCRPQTARNGLFDEVDYDWFKTDIDTAVKDQKRKLSLDEIQTPKEFSPKKGENEESKEEEEMQTGSVMRSKAAHTTERSKSRSFESIFGEPSGPPGYGDMKLVMKHLGSKLFEDTPEKKERKFLTANEVEFYYHALKRSNIRNNFTVEERLDIIEQAWNTLELLMKSLMLQREFEILNDSCKRKQLDIDLLYNTKKSNDGQPILDKETDKNITEQILKVLIRLKKTFDATESITKILLKITKRENLVNQFLAELDDCSNIRAKGYYYVILKISSRIYNQIERLRVDHPLLNRPFIYANSNYCPYLIKDGLIIRRIVMKCHPEIKDQLDRVLDKSGKIVPISFIVELNQEMQYAMEEDIATGIVKQHTSPGKRNYMSMKRHGGCGHKRAYKLNRLQALADRDSMGFFDDLFMFAMRNPELSLDY